MVIIAGDTLGSRANDVPTVLGQLPEPRDAVTIVGCIDVWQNPVNEAVLMAAFQKLTDSLKALTKLDWGDGTYGAKIEGDAIKVFRIIGYTDSLNARSSQRYEHKVAVAGAGWATATLRGGGLRWWCRRIGSQIYRSDWSGCTLSKRELTRLGLGAWFEGVPRVKVET